MRAERESMTGMDAHALALGGDQRSDEPPRVEAGQASRTPDPEVVAKRLQRQVTAEYRLRILEEADRCTRSGQVGRLLRRDDLYTSLLLVWRQSRRKLSLQGLTPQKPGAKPAEPIPLSAKVRQIEAKVGRLDKELATAHAILEAQRKLPRCWDSASPTERTADGGHLARNASRRRAQSAHPALRPRRTHDPQAQRATPHRPWRHTLNQPPRSAISTPSPMPSSILQKFRLGFPGRIADVTAASANVPDLLPLVRHRAPSRRNRDAHRRSRPKAVNATHDAGEPVTRVRDRFDPLDCRTQKGRVAPEKKIVMILTRCFLVNRRI